MFLRFKIFVLLFIVWIAFPASVKAELIWEKVPYKIFLQNDIVEIFHEQSKIMEITSFTFNFVEPDTILVENVHSDTLELKLLFNENDGFHDDFPSQIKLIISHFGNTFHFSAFHKTFNHITIKMRDLNEHYFGLIEKLFPYNEKTPDLRGNTIDLDVYARGEKDYAENYASVYSAFYMSSSGYGSFFDTFNKGRYQFAINGMTELYHQTGSLDWYIFYGPSGEKIHKEYYHIIGKPKFVPLWACGPIFWRDQNDGGKDELLDDIRNFTKHKIPLTACWVDRPYSNGANEWSKMNFNEKFMNPEVWIKQINQEYGLQFMTWIAPMTFSDKDFPGLLANYKGYIDLTHPDALNEFEKRLTSYQYSVGVKGHKMDRSDENFPFTTKWHEPVSESESRNKYVYLYSRVIHNFLLKTYGKDQFNFARAAFNRCQPFLSAVWGGDSRSNWQGMAGNQANAMRCGFMGFPVWGQDTGGYLGAGQIDEALYIRWLQWGVWNGMFEIKIDGSGGSGEDRPPWKYSQKLQDVFRNVCELRMRLLPYIYSCANTSYLNGVLMKPLAYMYPGDKNTYSIWDEYIFGNVFLIAPLFTRENKRQIYLPQGKWYDFYDQNNEYTGPITFSIDIPAEKIPVYIKANSIYITGQIYQGNSKSWLHNVKGNEEISIHLFPGEIGDSTTFQYVDYLDHDHEKIMTLLHGQGKIIFRSDTLTAKSNIKLKCKAEPVKILVNEKSVTYDFDKTGKMVTLQLEKNKAVNLELFYYLSR
jgi:alpha-glucosidase (family GH31 glycosyl hydrolase)